MASFRHPECMPAGKGTIARRTQCVHFAEMRSLFAEQRPISIGSPSHDRRHSDCSATSEETFAVSRIRPLPLPRRPISSEILREGKRHFLSPRKQNDERGGLHKEKREAVMDT